MGVYIKGMKMPETCGKCKLNFLTDDYVCCLITDRIPKIVGKYANSKTDLDYRLKSIESVKRPEWCPLVEVKEPHGRLIDADALMLTIKDNMDYFEHEGVDACCYFLDSDGEPSAELWCVEDWIDNSKTVIEGSE